MIGYQLADRLAGRKILSFKLDSLEIIEKLKSSISLFKRHPELMHDLDSATSAIASVGVPPSLAREFLKIIGVSEPEVDSKKDPYNHIRMV
jgi:hypothetical protein